MTRLRRRMPGDVKRVPPEHNGVRLRVVRSAGTVDVLINNAALQHVARIEDFPSE